MATYINKNMIDGVEELPRLTEEEFLAIPVAERPKIWVKRNATETDRGITAEDVQYDNTSSGLSATDTQGAIDEIVDFDKYIPVGGNYMAEAQSNGRIKMTIPFYNRRGYNVATLSHTVSMYISIYGTKSAAGVYANLYSCNIRDNRFIEIVFELISGYTLSTYTDLTKGFLLELGGMTVTLSKS